MSRVYVSLLVKLDAIERAVLSRDQTEALRLLHEARPLAERVSGFTSRSPRSTRREGAKRSA